MAKAIVQTAHGKILLRVTGIIYMVVGTVIAAYIIMTTIGMISIIRAYESPFDVFLTVTALLTVAVMGAFALITGIMGVKYCGLPQKAKLLKRVAIINLIVSAVLAMLFADGGAVFGTPWFTVDTVYFALTGLALAAVYFIGTIKSRREDKNYRNGKKRV